MTKIKNSMNYVPKVGKKFTQPSQTIPDQSLSIQEIVRRYMHNIPLDATVRTAVYEDEEPLYDGVNPATLDLADIQAIREDNKAEIIRLKNQMAYEQSEKERKQKEQELVKQSKYERQELERRNQATKIKKSSADDKFSNTDNDGNGDD